MIIPLLGVAVLVWMAITWHARRRVRHCRWRADRSRDTSEDRYFVCVACGAERYVSGSGPPSVCARRTGTS